MLLSGVVRNRKLALSSVVRAQRDASDRQRLQSSDSNDHGHNSANGGNHNDEYAVLCVHVHAMQLSRNLPPA